MVLENYVSESTAQLVWLIATIALFAGLGAIYAHSGKVKNADEDFDWSKGKYPVAAMSATGAIAGIITLLTTGEFDIVVFGAALATVGILLDQLREMFQAGSERYGELREKEVNQSEAGLLALRHAIESGDIEGMRAAIGGYSDEHGEPSMDTARETSEQNRKRIRDEGVRGVINRDFAYDPPRESDGEGMDMDGPPPKPKDTNEDGDIDEDDGEDSDDEIDTDQSESIQDSRSDIITEGG
jgi:hypothetical protein